MKIITKLIIQAEQKINEELKVIDKDIDDFAKFDKVPSFTEVDKRAKWFKERMTGRLSTDALTKNYERKLDLEQELQEIVHYKYTHQEEFQ